MKAADIKKAKKKGTGRSNPYINTRGGTPPDIGIYFRSWMEANIWRILAYEQRNGKINRFEYESITYEVPHLRSKKVSIYKPDFLVTRNDGTQYLFEWKGYLDKTKATIMRAFARHYRELWRDMVFGVEDKRTEDKIRSLATQPPREFWYLKQMEAAFGMTKLVAWQTKEEWYAMLKQQKAELNEEEPF